jgi:hypothetical protein
MEPMAVSAQTELKAYDRIITLEPIDGKKPLSSTGLVDPRLFKQGEDGNKLRAVMDPSTCLWSMKYEKGGIPEGLAGSFTGINALLKAAEAYFLKRNIRITAVKDNA